MTPLAEFVDARVELGAAAAGADAARERRPFGIGHDLAGALHDGVIGARLKSDVPDLCR
jgi:hypothetical protein